MSLTAARLQFAAEFITLVVTASALALLLLRPPQGAAGGRGVLQRVQAAMAGLALLVLGGGAFTHGSILVSGQHVEWIGLARLAAGMVLLVAFPYPGGPRSGRPPIGGFFLRIGFLGWSAAGAVELSSGQPYVADGLLVGGSLLVAAALVRVSRRSIAVRVATSGAAALLLVVVVLALALSTVISSSVQKQEISRLAARAAVERLLLDDSGSVATDAEDVQALLAADFNRAAVNPLIEFASGDPAAEVSAAAAIHSQLDTLPARARNGIVAYASPDGTRVLIAGQPGVVSVPGFATAPDLRATCSSGQRGLFVFDGSLFLAASSPECTAAGQLVGVVVVADPIDDGYIAARVAVDPGVGMAVVSGGKVLASAGTTPERVIQIAAGVRPPAGSAVTEDSRSGYVSVADLSATSASGRPVDLQLVLDDRTNSVIDDRNRLFRTLFLVAFGGTIVALGLAVYTGDRITAGVRRLTRAAADIAAGQSAARAGVPGEDEVAALGSAFDSMIDAVSAQSAALQAAADDETRLRNRLEAVVGGMSDALVAVDNFGRITDFNQAAADLTGVERESALGAEATRVIRLRNEEGAPIVRQLIQPEGRISALPARVVRDGSEVPVAVSSGTLRGPNGEAAGTVLVLRDMRREQEVERMKTEFLSRIGHELRTPLTGILGYADILLRRPVNESTARSWHEDILHSARRLLRIVEMLEFFASEGAGRVVLRPAPVDLRALVSGITSSWSGRLPANLTIGRRLPKGPTMVIADQRWLTMAIDELIDNAVKFSPEGGRIVVKVTAAGDAVEISVADQGMGMTAQHHEVIFGDFVQGDNSDTRRFGGLGLGLAVVRRVVEGHGGTITCRSAPGRGTTFVIGLPNWPEPPPGPGGNGSTPGRRPVRARRRSPTDDGGRS